MKITTVAQLKKDITSRSPKRNKYGAQKTEYNGRTYHSKAEANYAKRLEWLKHAHELKDRVIAIDYQPCYPIYINHIHIFDYFADFTVRYGDGRVEVVDVKGVQTDVYKIKKHCVEAFYGIKIKEIMNKDI